VTTLVDRLAVSPRVEWRRAVLTAVAGVFYGVGWLASMCVRFVLLGATILLYWVGRSAGWAFAAVKVGWVDAQRQGRRGPA
jgi:hypothetical protein